MTERLPRSRFYREPVVWIDQFSTFSPTTLKLLEQLTESRACFMTVSPYTLERGGGGRDSGDLCALPLLVPTACMVRPGAPSGRTSQLPWDGPSLPAELMHLEKEALCLSSPCL